MSLNPLRPTASAARNLSLLLRHAPRSTARFHNNIINRAHSTSSSSSSVSPDELTHFSSLASSWWDPLGPSRILHLMNPLRHEFIAECLAESFPKHKIQTSTSTSNTNIDGHAQAEDQDQGLTYLDIGCGGGIFAESLARTIPSPSPTQSLSLSPVTHARSILAIDPSPTMIKIATNHARADPHVYSHLLSKAFRYENTTLEALVAPTPNTPNTPPEKFNIITLFEVLEHVDPNSTSSPRSFLHQALSLLQPGGWLIGSTIARTWPAYVVNQVIAEAPWPIGVVPRGTHEWGKFVNPEELRGWVGAGAGAGAGNEKRRWKCVGAMYFPGVGWRMVPGAERWGNYFWAVQRGF
ncbi:Hexaprenyldihydroxybenzoate methyltransferase, mitochondrial [Emmonsiellopsis sp. PD_33]|nr:Hexaprenyldihydroxybenzoate methyltransferase, mitochondrial [Emmonsiellopsis sp. PD_33]